MSFKENCPTCGTPCDVTWQGLELVENSGDETLASKSYVPESPSAPVEQEGREEIIRNLWLIAEHCGPNGFDKFKYELSKYTITKK